MCSGGKLTLVSEKRPSVPYDFNEYFYKIPCYLRRVAINKTLGIYDESNLDGIQDRLVNTSGLSGFQQKHTEQVSKFLFD